MSNRNKGKRVLYAGIDFGTSTTAIAYDNGVRAHIPTCVGIPKDGAAKNRPDQEIVIGEDALNSAGDITLFYPIEKGLLKYAASPGKNPAGYKKTISASRHLLKHLLNRITKGAPGDYEIRGVIGVPPPASQKNKKALYEIARGLIDGLIIVSGPFSVAYGLDLINSSLIIDIGAGTVDLCRIHGTIPTEEDQITMFKAGDHIDRVFFDLIRKRYKPAELDPGVVRKIKEDNAFITEPVERVFLNSAVKGKTVRYDVTDELKMACSTIVPEIVRGIDILVSTFDPEFQDELKDNVLLTGRGSRIIGLKTEVEKYMKKTLGYGRVRNVPEPLYAGTNGAFRLCKETPEEYWRELQGNEHQKDKKSG